MSRRRSIGASDRGLTYFEALNSNGTGIEQTARMMNEVENLLQASPLVLVPAGRKLSAGHPFVERWTSGELEMVSARG